MASTVLLVSLAIFLILNMPVGLAIGLSTLAALLTGESLSLNSLAQQMVISCDSFPILAVPLFILAGDLMGAGGVSRRILNVCNIFFGRITGGLAIVTAWLQALLRFGLGRNSRNYRRNYSAVYSDGALRRFYRNFRYILVYGRIFPGLFNRRRFDALFLYLLQSKRIQGTQ